jgi:membrane-bound metal-dependent hydrolase YbcI (DUF457 family)
MVYMCHYAASFEDKGTFAVGHIALGYLASKTSSRVLGVRINIPLIFLASMLPDLDLLLGSQHRGPTHSLLVYAAAFAPIFFLYGKQVVPFFASLTQHSLLGDMLTWGGVQLLWPVFSRQYGMPLQITSELGITLEWIVFFAGLTLLWKTGDVAHLFQHHSYNLLLTVPLVAIILPAFMSFPLTVPAALIVPHLVLLGILGMFVALDIKGTLKARHQGTTNIG